MDKKDNEFELEPLREKHIGLSSDKNIEESGCVDKKGTSDNSKDVQKSNCRSRLNENEINIKAKMRFIGYYMSDEQFMKKEKYFVDKAEDLAYLLQKTFLYLLENPNVDDNMRKVMEGNTVFILKDENGHLFGYYPQYNIARITGVHYCKPDVTPMPLEYKRWFVPGTSLRLIRDDKNI